MPRIDDDVLDCALYLYHSKEDAAQGMAWGGSGFVTGVPYGWDRKDRRVSAMYAAAHHLYAVTTRHVIEAGATVIRLNTKEGATRLIDLPANAWKCHEKGDDLAIAAIELDRQIDKFKYISILGSIFITEEHQQRLALGPGDETFTVGRFIARDERQSNVPIVRFGHISGPKTEPIDQGEPRDHFKQESFLVESHSIGGLSGAPVFVWIPLERTVQFTDDKLRLTFRKAVRSYQHDPHVYFLGVDWGHLDDEAPPGMAGVVPAWKLLELLTTDEVLRTRQEKEQSTAKIPHSKLDVRPRKT